MRIVDLHLIIPKIPVLHLWQRLPMAPMVLNAT
jgi:hypothetical protein